jgi:hypothetical protein
MVGNYHYENIEEFGVWGQAYDSFKEEFWLRRTSMITFVFILCCYKKLYIAKDASYCMNLELELGMVKRFSLIHM